VPDRPNGLKTKNNRMPDKEKNCKFIRSYAHTHKNTHTHTCTNICIFTFILYHMKVCRTCIHLHIHIVLHESLPHICTYSRSYCIIRKVCRAYIHIHIHIVLHESLPHIYGYSHLYCIIRKSAAHVYTFTFILYYMKVCHTYVHIHVHIVSYEILPRIYTYSHSYYFRRKSATHMCIYTFICANSFSCPNKIPFVLRMCAALNTTLCERERER